MAKNEPVEVRGVVVSVLEGEHGRAVVGVRMERADLERLLAAVGWGGAVVVTAGAPTASEETGS